MLVNFLTLKTQITSSDPVKTLRRRIPQSHKHFNVKGDCDSPKQCSNEI